MWELGEQPGKKTGLPVSSMSHLTLGSCLGADGHVQDPGTVGVLSHPGTIGLLSEGTQVGLTLASFLLNVHC